MIRLFAVACTMLAVSYLIQGSSPIEGAQAQKGGKMVNGTIKEVQADKDVLIINQKLKGQVVDRELSIEPTTEFIVMKGGGKKTAIGSDGLKLLVDAKGASCKIKCDKDVKVLSVTVTIK